MAYVLYIHPLASFCHKVLIAFAENDVPFEARTVDLMDPGSAAALLDKWPVGKIPVLHDTDADRIVPETSVIIEYVEARHAGPVPMLPADPDERLDARLWDRFFDLYVSVPMQKIVVDRLRPAGSADPFGVDEARRTLDTAYAMIDSHMAGRQWCVAERFTLAECAAAPGLFFSSIVHPFAPGQSNLSAYFERLLARPSVRQAIDGARPFFKFFPYVDAMPERFQKGE